MKKRKGIKSIPLCVDSGKILQLKQAQEEVSKEWKWL